MTTGRAGSVISRDPLGVIAFFSRWMLGILLLMAGWFKVFEMGPLEHARALFVEPYADTWIPSFLLWTLGATIPVFELIAGVALVLGLGTRAVSIAVGVLLLIVTYGHVLLEPFYDVTTHVLPRFPVARRKHPRRS